MSRRDEYVKIYEIDGMDAWQNTAYDESGDSVICDLCGVEFRFSRARNEYYCPDCGQTLSRVEFLDYIGSVPPSSECVTNCRENYPFCKEYCEKI
jgi:predicted RNA-binding Zn-ribbon protein involved in translation (DUF1610 family)